MTFPPAHKEFDFLKEKEEKNSVKMIAIASGDGSLTLAFESKLDKKISDVRVTNRDIAAFLYREGSWLSGWKAYYNNGFFRLYQPVERIGIDEVLVHKKSYRYAKIHDQCFHIFDEEGNETRNSTICGAIMFFVNNEEKLR